MMMMSFATIGIVSVLWVIYGFSLAFGDSGNGFWGGAFGLSGLGERGRRAHQQRWPVPHPAAGSSRCSSSCSPIITPALISGAIADRAKFLTWGIFVALWVTIVYFPVAHWVFDFGDKAPTAPSPAPAGSRNLGVEDFAGGTAVHINAGAAGLALAIVLGRRIGWSKKNPNRPHNLPLVLLGAGLLWFGWFGFNAGSALAANRPAALALTNTQVATAAALGGWLLVEKIRDGHPTTLGAASGAVAGLVAITPACAFIAPVGGDPARRPRRRDLLPRGRPEVPARTSTTRSTSSASTSSAASSAACSSASSAPAHVGLPRPSTASSTAAAGRCSATRRSAPFSVLAYSFIVDADPRLPAREDARLPHQPRTPSSRASTSPSTPSRRTSSRALGGGGLGGSRRRPLSRRRSPSTAATRRSRHEARHRHHQAVQARRREVGPRGLRDPWA